MENEFLLIVEKASIQVTRTRDQEEGHVGRRGRGPVRENVPKQLTKMFQICFERFHAVVLAHRILLSHFQRTKRTYKGQWIMLHEVDHNVICLSSSIHPLWNVRRVGGHPASGKPHPIGAWLLQWILRLMFAGTKWSGGVFGV